MRLFWKAHLRVYRSSSGRIGANILGNQIVHLTTIGRRSGQPHSVLVYAFPIEDEDVVVGSNAGADTHSHWYLNLVANPKVTVEMSGETYEAIARVTEGEERDRLWASVLEMDPSYAEYEKRTDRIIPVIVLDPAL